MLKISKKLHFKSLHPSINELPILFYSPDKNKNNITNNFLTKQYKRTLFNPFENWIDALPALPDEVQAVVCREREESRLVVLGGTHNGHGLRQHHLEYFFKNVRQKNLLNQ